MKERTCFNCQHSKMCVVKKAIIESTKELRFNIDAEDAPRKWVDIFKVVAESCLEFKLKKVT